jgi:glycosyltransferase involved in cell wall biosynthesis
MERSFPNGDSPADRQGFRKLSVLMPVYNEVRTLRMIVDRVLNAPIELTIELVVVDDGSTDGSRELISELAAADPRVRPFFHDKNQGKAGAIRTAIREMTGDLALVQDADLEYDPADYPVLLKPVLDGLADAVFGSRFLTGSHRRVMYFWHTLVNHFLTLMCNLFNNINLTDMETGYKLIRADVLRSIPLTSSGFAFEPELTTKLAQWGLRVYEVPISYAGRTYAEGKKIGWRDGLRALWALFKYRFLSGRFTTHEGFYIMQSVRHARSFNRWMLRRIAPYIGNRVLEGGCGIGNLTELLLDRQRLVCLDYDPFYVEVIHRRYGHLANVKVRAMDLARAGDDPRLREEKLDTVICLNVLEHIEDDQRTLEGFYNFLEPGGHAIILVPAHPGLYTGVDKALGHYRRYTAAQLRARMASTGFEVVHCEGFNRLGSLGWFVSGKVLRKTTLSPGQMKLFEWLMPMARLLERVPVLPHLSLIAVGRKPLRPSAGLAQPKRAKAA